MCGISGILSLDQHKIDHCAQKLEKMDSLLAHRGPDDAGIWVSRDQRCGLGHRRLSIIDLSNNGHQPMIGENGHALVFNGAIYNYKEITQNLKANWNFRSHSDTEVILAAYQAYGEECLNHFRGMFAFAIWDGDTLFCARDRFGIKPFFYTLVNNTFYFASEAKALLPFLPEIATDPEAFSEYIAFQCPVSERTLFKGIYQLMPGHALKITQGKLTIWQYWDLHFRINHDLTKPQVIESLGDLMSDSIAAHLESDVAVGAYVGGGMDSSLVAILASKHLGRSLPMFHGRFMEYPGYDESDYASLVSQRAGSVLHLADLTSNDFSRTIEQVIYHLDFPVAGPGSFAQYMISEVASQHVKVVLGGQGGDEIFGGYARYLITYFEQCLRAAIDDDYCPTKLPIRPDTMINNLSVIKEYKPMISQVWSKDLFGDFTHRYFAITNRSIEFTDELEPGCFKLEDQLAKFISLFESKTSLKDASYFDSMLRFDFKYSMPGLLHVEDRVSMAHGLESRVPFLDHPLIEFMATVPSRIKFENGQMKGLMKQTFKHEIPSQILERKDKMGFPVPITEWMRKDLKEFIFDTLQTGANKKRDFVDYKRVIKNCETTGRYSRKLWAFLSYELWNQAFHDKKSEYLFQVKDELVA